MTWKEFKPWTFTEIGHELQSVTYFWYKSVTVWSKFADWYRTQAGVSCSKRQSISPKEETTHRVQNGAAN